MKTSVVDFILKINSTLLNAFFLYVILLYKSHSFSSEKEEYLCTDASLGSRGKTGMLRVFGKSYQRRKRKSKIFSREKG